MFRILYSFIVVIGDTTVLNRLSLETELWGQVGMQGDFCSSSVKRQWDTGLGGQGRCQWREKSLDEFKEKCR